ncbi:MAG: CHAD domain-containing protein [Candidatus Binatia bacterium]
MEPTDAGIAAQGKLLKLTRKRLERFVTFVPKFLVNDDPDTIHDLRVWSRRLQQTIRSLSSQAKPRGSRKLIKILRHVRQALGSLRNLDVNTELVQSRLEKAPAPVLRDAWEAVKNHLQENRRALLAEARAEVAKYDIVSFIERAQKLLSRAGADADPTEKLKKAVVGSLTEWDEAHGLATESRSVEHLHGLRIATKRLRYRAELLAAIGGASSKPMVKDLKEIQSALGDWHDRSVLLQFIADLIADFRASHPEMAGALLAQMEQEKKCNDDAIEDILNRIPKLRKRWDAWHDKHQES